MDTDRRRADDRGRDRSRPGERDPRRRARWGRRARWAIRARGVAAYKDSLAASSQFAPDGPTRASDPLLLYFTCGTTAQPKLVQHTHAP